MDLWLELSRILYPGAQQMDMMAKPDLANDSDDCGDQPLLFSTCIDRLGDYKDDGVHSAYHRIHEGGKI